ncbi:MAG: hypothetical protein HY319_12460 [Armatimonadetes bacterium]|nr:hypothetical protein [Armatimonadota bacterium]
MRISPACRPSTPPRVRLPEDDGSHPTEKTEWWYLNGHLEDEQGRTYDFVQALFDVPDAIAGRYNVDLPMMPGATALDTGLTRHQGGHSQRSRMTVRAPYTDNHDLTPGAMDHQFGGLHLKRWDAQTFTVSGPAGEAQVDLRLTQQKPPLLMGGQGEIPMGPYGLSRYYTYPMLAAEGVLHVNGEERRVHGQAWMDHQWGDMQMYNGYQGWDWFGLQLENNTQVNAFRFRSEDGTNASAAVGISRPDGTQDVSEQLRLRPGRTWHSPSTGADYPLEWHLSIPDKAIDLDVRPLQDAQEMVGTPPHTQPELALVPTYWEGGVAVQGTVDGQPVSGKGFMELVGYPGDRIIPRELTQDVIDLARRLGEEARSRPLTVVAATSGASF